MKKLIFILFVAGIIGCKKESTSTPTPANTWISGKWIRTKRVFTYVQYSIAKKDSSTATNELNFINESQVTSTEVTNQSNPYFLTSIEGAYIDFEGSHWIINKISNTKLTLSGQIYIIIPYNYTDTYIKE